MTDIRPLRLQIDVDALERNARFASVDDVADVSRDACGHGIALVASVLVRAGVRFARVDAVDQAAAQAEGLTATDAAPTLDVRTLYGLPGGAGEPAFRLAGSVLSIKPLLAGEGVSYNYTHRAVADTRIALVTGGFGQGVVRSLGNEVSVEIGGALHPVIGRVAMDVCVVDVGDSEVSAGDEVVFFGGAGPVRDGLARWEAVSGLTAAELVCALGLRLPREVSR